MKRNFLFWGLFVSFALGQTSPLIYSSTDAREIALSGAAFTYKSIPFSSQSPFMPIAQNSHLSIGQYPDDINSVLFSQSFRLSSTLSCAGAFQMMNFGKFDGYDEFGNPTGKFSAYEQISSVGIQKDFGVQQFPSIGHITFSIHNVKQQFATTQIKNTFSSLGFRYNIPKTEIAVVSVWKNFNLTNMGTLGLGIGKNLRHLPIKSELSFDYDFAHHWTVRASGILKINPYCTAYFGTSTLRFDQTSYTVWDFLNATSVGFGFHREKIHFDYGFWVVPV